MFLNIIWVKMVFWHFFPKAVATILYTFKSFINKTPYIKAMLYIPHPMHGLWSKYSSSKVLLPYSLFCYNSLLKGDAANTIATNNTIADGHGMALRIPWLGTADKRGQLNSMWYYRNVDTSLIVFSEQLSRVSGKNRSCILIGQV